MKKLTFYQCLSNYDESLSNYAHNQSPVFSIMRIIIQLFDNRPNQSFDEFGSSQLAGYTLCVPIDYVSRVPPL